MFLAYIQVFVAFLATRLHSRALLEAESVYIHKILSGCMSAANMGHVMSLWPRSFTLLEESKVCMGEESKGQWNVAEHDMYCPRNMAF